MSRGRSQLLKTQSVSRSVRSTRTKNDLGVDPHKGEVLQVYRAMEDVTGLNVESDVAGPSKVFPSNPL